MLTRKELKKHTCQRLGCTAPDFYVLKNRDYYFCSFSCRREYFRMIKQRDPLEQNFGHWASHIWGGVPSLE